MIQKMLRFSGCFVLAIAESVSRVTALTSQDLDVTFYLITPHSLCVPVLSSVLNLTCAGLAAAATTRRAT